MGGDSKLRKDGLALDDEGNLVVFEFKRDGKDNNVHLQALTYAALFSGLKKDDLMKMRIDYIKKNITNEQNGVVEGKFGAYEDSEEECLTRRVTAEIEKQLEGSTEEEDSAEDKFYIPRIILIA